MPPQAHMSHSEHRGSQRGRACHPVKYGKRLHISPLRWLELVRHTESQVQEARLPEGRQRAGVRRRTTNDIARTLRHSISFLEPNSTRVLPFLVHPRDGHLCRLGALGLTWGHRQGSFYPMLRKHQPTRTYQHTFFKTTYQSKHVLQLESSPPAAIYCPVGVISILGNKISRRDPPRRYSTSIGVIVKLGDRPLYCL